MSSHTRAGRIQARHLSWLASLPALITSASGACLAQDAQPQERPQPAQEPATKGYDFEWGGVFELPSGTVALSLMPGPDDPSMKVVLVAVRGLAESDFDAVLDGAQAAFAGSPAVVAAGGSLAADGRPYQLTLAATPMHFTITVETAGAYALFTEHMPWEFQATLRAGGAALAPRHVRQLRQQLVELTPVALKTSGLRVGRAQRRRLTATVVAPARVSFNREAMAHVGTQVTGRIAEIKVRQGDTVESGQALLVVESPDLGAAQSDYLLKKTAAEAAVPAVDLAKNAHERAEALYKSSQGISLTEVQRREAEYRAAQAASRSAESAKTAAENRLHLLGMNQRDCEELARTGEISPRYTVKAPIAGTVVEREVTLGELVDPQREALCVLADLRTVWVLADVPEARIREIRIGTRAVVTAVSSGAAEIDGVVSYIAPLVDPASRTAQVRIEVSGAAGLRAGMFARVELRSMTAGGDEPVLAIPEDAVQTVDGQPCVFVPVGSGGGSFAKRLVLLDSPIAGLVRIRCGLGEGEAVVVANSFILKAELGKSGALHSH